MACYRLMTAWRVENRGLSKICFSKSQAFRHGCLVTEIKLPCGRCIGCKLAHSQKWAVRCVHESQSHLFNCFATVTYNDEHLPKDFSVKKSDLQSFFKALRYHYGTRFSYFACGEYGGRFGRPHYHICFFGLDDDTKIPLSSENPDNPLFLSPVFTYLWGKGNVVIGSLNYRTAAYVARYTLKKVRPKDAEDTDFYTIPDPFNPDKTITRDPVFSLMSLKPAIGKNWIHEFYPEVYTHDACFYRGRKISVPRYYDECLKKIDEDFYTHIKNARLERVDALNLDLSEKRMQTVEYSKILKQNFYTRSLEKATIYD